MPDSDSEFEERQKAWTSIGGVDWDADQSGVQSVDAKVEAPRFTAFVDSDEAENSEVRISALGGDVLLSGHSESDGDTSVQAGIYTTPDEARRIARQLELAADAAESRGGADVRL